jgi:hypothetical protein
MRKGFRNAVESCILLKKSFWDGVPVHSITKIPLALTVKMVTG